MTTPTLDPYRDWLGIAEVARPLDHYQLLRVKRFEDDSAKIRENYHKLYAHVRKQLQGKAAHLAHKLLGELTKAMLCLTDAERKAEYDTSLGRAVSTEKKRQTFDELLVARKVIDREQLVKARKFLHNTGIELHDAVVQQKLASSEVVTQLRAESLGVSYVDPSEAEIDADVVAKLPAVLARNHSIIPLMIEHGRVIIAAASPLPQVVEDEVRLRFGMPARLVLAPPAKLHEVVDKYYPREAAAAEMGVTRPQAREAEEEQEYVDPVERAKKRQQVTMIAGMLSFGAISLIGPYLLPTLEWYSNYGLAAVVAAIAAGIAWKMT